MKVTRKLIAGLALALMLLLSFSTPAFAAIDATVTVTATPSYISISIAQNTWTVNGIDGTGKIAPATTYYSNADGVTGDVTPPSATVLIAECYFVVANASTVETDLTTNMIHFTGGDAMQNSDLGYTSAAAGQFGASTYITGALWPSASVICKNSASAAMKSNLAATTQAEFGIAIKTQSDVWTSGDAMTSTITVTATDST